MVYKPELISLSFDKIGYSAVGLICGYFERLLPVAKLVLLLHNIGFDGSATIGLRWGPLEVHVVLVPVCYTWRAWCTWGRDKIIRFI